MKKAINGKDLLMFVQSISSERGIPFEEVLSIFADSLAQSLRKSSDREYRESDFRVHINPTTGESEAFRRWRVLGEEELMEAPEREMILEEAQERSGEEDINPGDIIEEPLESFDFNRRISMLFAKQYLIGHLREAERRNLLNEMLSNEDDLISGQVLRLSRNKSDAIIEVMRVDCRLPRSEMIPREQLKVGDRIQAVIKETVVEKHGEQVILSRITPEFLVLLFKRYVPEIEKGILEIVSAVRSPGNRAKIAVRSSDPRIDPVGTCVGVRGSRVQQVTNELNGERIDIIHWDEDDAKYVLRALSPAEISKISLDRERHRMDILVEPDLMAQAIGRNGTNVRLASELTGWQLNLVTPEEYETESEKIAVKKSTVIAETLDLETDAARILYDEGFETLEHVAYVDTADLLEIEGFNEEVVENIQQRARQAVEKKETLMREKLTTVEETLRTLSGMEDQLLYDLVNEDILTLEMFAELSIDELLEISEIPAQKAADLIVLAREMIEEAGLEGETSAATSGR